MHVHANGITVVDGEGAELPDTQVVGGTGRANCEHVFSGVWEANRSGSDLHVRLVGSDGQAIEGLLPARAAGGWLERGDRLQRLISMVLLDADCSELATGSLPDGVVGVRVEADLSVSTLTPQLPPPSMDAAHIFEAPFLLCR